MNTSEMNGAIVVVSGLPRSGTSMMMQMLAAGGLPVLTDQVRQADEDNPKGYFELEVVKKVGDDAAWLEGAGGKAFKMVYRLLYDLPKNHHYRVICMRRDLSEVIASQEVMLQRRGASSDGIGQDRLASIYRRQLDDVDAWLRDQPNFAVHYVDYHDVLDHPARVVAGVNHFLGNSLNEESMLAVPDESLYRKRR